MSCTTCTVPGGSPMAPNNQGKRRTTRRRRRQRLRVRNDTGLTRSRFGSALNGASPTDVLTFAIEASDEGWTNSRWVIPLYDFLGTPRLLSTDHGRLESGLSGIGRMPQLTDRIVAIEYMLDGCCSGTCPLSIPIAHGYRGSYGVGSERSPGTNAPVPRDPQVKADIFRWWLQACTRGTLTPGKSVRIPVPPDVLGLTLEEMMNGKFRGPIISICLAPKQVMAIYMRLWVTGAGCTIFNQSAPGSSLALSW